MVKTGDEKALSESLKELQLGKGTYDSPCMSICNYDGLFKECQTCHLRQVEKKLWKTGNQDMKETILRAVGKRVAVQKK